MRALLLIFCLLISAPALAGDDPFRLAETPFYKQLDGFTGYNMPIMQISQKIKKKLSEDPSKGSIALKWAEDKSFGAADITKVNALYFLVFADLNIASLPSARGDRDAYKKYTWSAFQSLLILEAMLGADAARCSGVDAKAAVSKLLGPRYAALDAYGLFWQKKIAHAWQSALDYEAATAKRAGNAEVCGNGLSEAEGETATVTPAYIDDATWQKSRDTVRAQLKTYWQQRYDEAMKPAATKP